MSDSPIQIAAPAQRISRQSRVVWGDRVVTVGGGAPVRVQSMTNTDTVDVIGTAIQVKELALAGSETIGSPGLEQLHWYAPVRPGDTLHVQGHVLEVRRSASAVWWVRTATTLLL